MTKLSKPVARCAAAALCALGLFGMGLFAAATGAQAAGKIRIAFGDIATVETLNFQIAIERAKARGVEIDVAYLKSEDIAAQAVVSGDADVGVGTPYALLQKVRAPIRMFYQLSSLRFFPIVNTEFYQDWKDLDGEEIVVHSRGSGTEAIMNLMAQRHGIAYKSVSYVPGSEVRAGAMLQGNIKATIVDSANRRLLQQKGPDKFKVLPLGDINASDEALYANTEFLAREGEAVGVLVEELLGVWREINKDPGAAKAGREKLGLLPELPADLAGEIDPYFEEAVAVGMFPDNGGVESAAQDDFAFYSVAGQLEGDPKDLKVEDFWDYGPLEAALDKLGRM
ncbi:MAG: ABC transporter substrate-binding protein [Rhodospirillales bacterium]|nr:ABC transporter substrate-binding protein [Rhodospirillales bacterium]